jgi:hypothetical protein
MQGRPEVATTSTGSLGHRLKTWRAREPFPRRRTLFESRDAQCYCQGCQSAFSLLLSLRSRLGSTYPYLFFFVHSAVSRWT